MVSQSLADDEGVSKPSSSLPSRQPLGRNPPSESSSPRSEDVSGRAVGLPDLPVESTGDLRHPVEKPSISQSLLSASDVQHTVTPGDSSVPQPINSDVDTFGLPDVSVDSTGDQHHPITTRFTLKSTSSSPASQSQKTVPLGDDMLHSGNLEEDLRPQDLPLPPSPALKVKRSLESGTGSAHHGYGSDSSQQVVRLKGQSESFGSDKSDYGTQDGRRSYASSFRALPRVLHRAWTTTEDDYKYRHIVTGEIFHHRWREPQNPGPSADDIPDGWTAELVSEDEEDWVYVHCTTRTVIDTPPKSLPEAVIKQFDVAATYGNVPQNCQGQLEDGQLMYKCVNPSMWCPTKWRTAKHPEVIENEMNQYLANVKSNSTTPAAVTFLPKSGRQIPFDLEAGDISQMSGILLVTDIDKIVCNQLLATQVHTPLMSFFIICHLLLATLHEDEATKEFARQAQGWRWMSMRSETNDPCWSGHHYDIIHDDENSMLHFGFAQYLHSQSKLQTNTSTTRLSVFEATPDLVMVLIGNVTLDHDCIQNPYSREFSQPNWWMPAVPAYLGLSSSKQMEVRNYMIRLLRVVAQDLAAVGLPRVYLDDSRWDLDNTLDKLVTYRLVMSSWKDGIRYLKDEIGYFWEQAINGPDVRDFVRLKDSKRYAEMLYQDLGAWIVNMEGLLAPRFDSGGARAMNELKDLLDQILAFKQEIGDTFQLLIGAIAIKDSEIQKKLAQESKLQARRSTALTALAAIYLPLSLTTGVFGMNVVEIEEGRPRYWAALAVAMGLLLATLPFLVWVYLDKDEQGWNRTRPTVSGQHSADSQRHQVEKDDSTLSKSHSQDFDTRPLDLLRRRTTRYSQMSWAVTGGSQPGSTRKKAHPEHMV